MKTHSRFVAALMCKDEAVLLGRRSATRALCPARWDLPGGHVEPGEAPHRALQRELSEELGIETSPGRTPHASLIGPDWLLDCWLVEDWSGTPYNRDPQEHDEVRWCDLDAVRVLPLADEKLRRMLVGHLARERWHCIAVIDGRLGRRIESLRRRWDPASASSVPAHLTIAYPEESEDAGRTLPRAVASTELRPFEIGLTTTIGPDGGLGGVMIRADDIGGGWARTRRALLQDGSGLLIDPHVTVAHPRASPDPQGAWRALRDVVINETFTVRELSVVRIQRGGSALIHKRMLQS